jgi:predicted N-acetyltransferase YhbS
MALEIVPVRPEHVTDLARIAFESFRGIQAGHNFPLDLPTPETALMMLRMLTSRPDFYGVAAMLDGKLVGSNFTQLSDAVSGVGPITVEISNQERGIGKALMQHIIDYSLKNHGPMVRLMQDSFNMRSLSLYTSLGYRVVEPIVLMAYSPAEKADDTVRPLQETDADACDALCRRICKVSRRNELMAMIQHGSESGFIPHGRFAGSALRAYLIPGFIGHGVGETAGDLLITARQSARRTPPPAHRLFVPTRRGTFLREAVKQKMRCIKPMNLMALGPYETADANHAVWSPSIAY